MTKQLSKQPPYRDLFPLYGYTITTKDM